MAMMTLPSSASMLIYGIWELLWQNGGETVWTLIIIITADKTKYLKIIDNFDVMYSLLSIIFSRKLVYKYIENIQIFNGTNN